MRTEAELKNTIQKAQRAEQLLNDPMIQEFIIGVRGDLLNKFESTALNDDKERLSAWNQSQVLTKFLDKFTTSIKEGKAARLTLIERASNKIQNLI